MADIDSQWDLASTHAGIGTDRCHRWGVPGADLGGDIGAILLRPGPLRGQVPDGAVVPDAILGELDRAEHQRLHRIVVAVDTPAAVTGARLRHELEHVRQELAHPPLGGLHGLILEILRLKVGGLRGCAGMYINAMPHEHDANAAASTFLLEHHGPAASLLRADPNLQQLACSLVAPEPLETLPARMVAHLWLYRTSCQAFAEACGRPFGELVDDRFAGCGDYWRALEALATD